MGAISAALAQIFTIPVSVIATRQQLESTKQGQSIWQTTQDIMKQDGITGLWRGLKPSLVLTVNPAITYGKSNSILKSTLDAHRSSIGMFERFKVLLLGENAKMTPVQAFLIGALSKALATVNSQPVFSRDLRQTDRAFFRW